MLKAIKAGDVETIKQKYVHNPHPTNKDGESLSTTWMIMAGGLGTKSSVETLFELDPSSIDKEDMRKLTPIIAAVAKENLETLETIHRLRDCSIDVPRHSSDKTPLRIAVEECSVKAIDKLIELGADINQRDKRGDDLMSAAIGRGKPESVKKLCELKRGWIDARRKEDGLFHKAAVLNQGKCIRILYDAGYTAIDGHPRVVHTPLYGATLYGATSAMIALHALGSNAHFTPDMFGLMPVTCAPVFIFRAEQVEQSKKAAQLVRRLYYSRSLTEVLFFTQTQRISKAKRKR